MKKFMQQLERNNKHGVWHIYLNEDKYGYQPSCSIVAFGTCNNSEYVRKWAKHNFADLKINECYWLKENKPAIPMVQLLSGV